MKLIARSTRILLLACLTLFSHVPSALAVDCPGEPNFNGTYVLSSQVEVDAFPQSCDVITGGLEINGTDITSLTPLANVTAVSGNFWLQNTDLLTSTSGLEALGSIGGFLLVRNNDELTSLAGLAGVSSVGTDLIVEDNPKLSRLTGLALLTTLPGNLLIESNAVLGNLAGLNALTQIGGYAFIDDNPALASLYGLQNLRSIGGYFYIFSNGALTTLQGMNRLERVDGNLFVQSNTALSDCSKLLTVLDTVDENNDGPDPAGNSFDPADIGGDVDIFQNATGCDQISEIIIDTGNTGTPDHLRGCPSDANLINGATYAPTTQQELNFFPRNCTVWSKSISISQAGIIDLTPLSRLTSLSGLNISQSSSLETLDGLESLTAVTSLTLVTDDDAFSGDGIDVSALDNLEIANSILVYTFKADSLGGFRSLREVQRLNIGFGTGGVNTEVTEIYGFDSLETADSIEIVSVNGVMEEINGFNALTDVGLLRMGLNNQSSGSIRVTINAFNNLARADQIVLSGDQFGDDSWLLPPVEVVESLQIGGAALTDLDSLQNVSFMDVPDPTVDSDTEFPVFSLSFNDALNDLSALTDRLPKYIDLDVSNNPGINNLSWLSGVQGSRRLNFETNASLTDCSALYALIDSRDDGAPGPGFFGNSFAPDTDAATFEYNGSGCNFTTTSDSDYLAIVDPDGDGLQTWEDPFPNDTDNDGANNDLDAFPNDPTETADTDGDGLGDNRETQLGTDPSLADTDGDGFSDSEELEADTDPLSAEDAPPGTGLNIILIKSALDARS